MAMYQKVDLPDALLSLNHGALVDLPDALPSSNHRTTARPTEPGSYQLVRLLAPLLKLSKTKLRGFLMGELDLWGACICKIGVPHFCRQS